MSFIRAVRTAASAALIASLVISCAGVPAPAERAPARGTRGEREMLRLPSSNPAEAGPYEVASFRYGSPHNPRRPEYAHAAVPTEGFDLSPFFDEIDRSFWGYEASDTPVNGIVWYPLGDGPFPVFLIVHGNHDPAAFSEAGYGYLGELLAGRGIVTVSVDQNMLNGWHSGENGARAILLLEHARRVLSMNDDPGTPLAGRLDTSRVVLAGHSRGGEAAALAAMLNGQDRYPGDGTVELDYALPIRGVVSIAPVEGQYRPAGRKLPIPGNVHYLVLHGSQDGDVDTYMGLRFFHRPVSSTARRHAVWMYGADHSAFNSEWASKRDPVPSAPRLLLPAEAQQRASSVLISAFLEAAFDRNLDYAGIVETPYLAVDAGWLPATEYRTQFRRPGVEYLNTFEDDYRFETAALAGWQNSIHNAESWREFRFGLTDDTDTDNDTSANAGTWGLELSWEEGSESDSELVFRSETATQPFAADSISVDLVLTRWDSDEPFAIWLDVVSADGERYSLALHERHSIRPAPEVRTLLRRNRHYIPETVHVPLDSFEGLRRGREIEAIELRIPRDAAGRLIIPAMMLNGGGA
ncbi:MAG: alpha/beta hydrolase family protein [Spirochaetaceae bacterium]